MYIDFVIGKNTIFGYRVGHIPLVDLHLIFTAKIQFEINTNSSSTIKFVN